MRGGIATEVCDAPEGSEFDEVGATWSRDNVIVFMSRTFELQKVSAEGSTPYRSRPWRTARPHIDGRHSFRMVNTFLSVGSQAGDLGELRWISGRRTLDVARAFRIECAVSAGHLISLSGDQLVARRFDERARSVTGVPFPVTTTTKFRAWNRLGAFSVSHSGVLAYHPGGAIPIDQRLTWLAPGPEDQKERSARSACSQTST